MRSIFVPPPLTPVRTWVALGTAMVVDAVQLIIGPLGFFTPMDDALDVAAAAVMTWALGFHPLLLPTFVVELIPVVDMVPTWTGCAIAVIALRRRFEERQKPAQTPTQTPPDMDQMKRAKVVETPPNDAV